MHARLRVLLLALACASPTRAQEVMDSVAPVDAVDRLLWSAAGLNTLLAERDYPNALLLGLLSRASGDDGAVRVIAALGSRRSLLAGCRAETDALRGTACALRQLRPALPPALAGDLADEATRLVGLAVRAPATPRAGLDVWTAGAGDALQAYLESTLDSAWRVGNADAGDAAAALLHRLTGADPRAPALEILAGAAPLRMLIDRAGGLEGLAPGVPIAQLLAAHERHVAETLEGVNGFLRGAPAAAATLGEERLDWAARRSFAWLVSGVASAAGMEGEEAAGTIRTIGAAAADLRRAAAGFPQSLSSFGQSAAVLALGGNVLGIAANVTSFFSSVAGGGPSAARQVRALRATMDTLRTEMDMRFDRVDASLDALLVQLGGSFARLESAVATGNREVTAELRSIHGEVVALGRSLERVDENLHAYMQAGFDRDYNRSLVRCLEHRQRHLPPMDVMDFPTFAGCLTEFRTRAVRDARDAILTDQTTPTDIATAGAAFADLSPTNLGRRLPLLGRVARDRLGNPGMMVRASIANPVEWAIAAQAYLTVLGDWPDHARAVAPGDLEAILDVGRDLRATLHAITVTSAGVPRRDFFDALLALGATATDSLDARIARLVRSYEDDGLRRARADSVFPRIESADAGRPALPAGDAIHALVPPELAAARALGLGTVALRYRVTFRDSTSRENVARNGRDHDRVHWSAPHIAIDIRHDIDGPLLTLHLDAPPIRRRTEAVTGDARNPRVRRTTEHVTDPWAAFVADLWPGLTARGTWLVAVDSTGMRRIRDRLDEALKRHAAGAVDERVLAACSGVELQGETGAIRRTLDAMTAARSLLSAFVLFGLPLSAETHAGLHAALFGDDAIFDRDSLCGAVRGGDSLVRLVRVSDEPRRRMAALRDAVADILDQPDRLPETLDLVERTILQLETAREIQALRALAAVSQPGR